MAVLMATGLVVVFVTVLDDSFSAHRESQDSMDEFRLLLTVSDYIGGGNFSDEDNGFEVGVLSQELLQEKLPRFIERLRRQGIRIRVEIVSLEGDLLFNSESGGENFSRSIDLIVAYEREGREIPARLIVWIGKGSI